MTQDKLSEMLKQAFLSGVVVARNIPGHEECNGPKLWTQYKKYALSDIEESERIIDYILQEDQCNSLTPRIVDIAYSAFMNAHVPNKDDGGRTDWFNDTKPMVMKAIDQIRRALLKNN